LNRFFDIPMSLPPVDISILLQSMGDYGNDKYIYDIMCQSVIVRYNLSIREVSRYILLAKMAADDVMHENRGKHSFEFAEGRALSFCLYYVLPIMLGLKIVNPNKYEEFINGKDPLPLLEFADVREYLFDNLLSNNEYFGGDVGSKKGVNVEEKLKDVYIALFGTVYDGTIYKKNIGKCEFNKRTRDAIIRTAGLFSKYTTME
jgi:hypothetical protein